MDAVIVNDLVKNYKLYRSKHNTLKEKIIHFKSDDYIKYPALNNISLTIKVGETVGLIGRNGSGKSTLLKVISKILYPDNGEVIVNGRISSLLELGAGFHPDFSGRENIYMNASILGLSKKEIDAKLESIIAFSELGEYIESPVKTYSSGMYMRLAFSVAISVDPDVLLIDEVLAVGDNAFQNKCINKLRELKGIGKTIVIVSHDNSMIEKLCDKVFYLREGVLVNTGNPREIIMQYLDDVANEENKRLAANKNFDNTITKGKEQEIEGLSVKGNQVNGAEIHEITKNRWGNKKIEIINVLLKDESDIPKGLFKTEDKMIIEIYYKVNEDFDNVVFGIGIFTSEKICSYGTNTDIDRIKLEDIPKTGVMKFIVDSVYLLPGKYMLDIAIHKDDGEPYDYITNQYSFQVVSDINDTGMCRQPHNWNLETT